MTMQQYCLRWNNHQPNFISVFSSLLNSESLVDVTLAAEGRHLQAHKVVLSACSSYFQSLFTINPCQHPIVILKDVEFLDLKIIVDFMYYGEVNVSQEQLPHILKTAEMLKIKGLAEIPVDQSMSRNEAGSLDRAEVLATSGDTTWNNENKQCSPCPSSPSCRRKRLRKSSTGSGEKSESETHEPTTGSFDTVIKTDQRYSPDDCQKKSNNGSSSSTDVEQRCSSTDVEKQQHVPPTSQISMISQDYSTQPQQQSIKNETTIEVQRPSTSMTSSHHQQHHQSSECDKPSVTTHAQFGQMTMGTKRGRFLMRQQRIKKENEGCSSVGGTHSSSDSGGGGGGEFFAGQYLTVPPLRMERQCSDPLPTTSSSPPPGNLLTVPGSILLKQHSHPLLLSKSRSFSPPLFTKQEHQTDRALSPVVVVTDPLMISQEIHTLKGDVPTLRVRTDELKRSASSPQASTRSRHCPVVRPGPALGCNYCWNTVDNHGRILRRKTKYHCPECQTNLCIVPCFQEYHERHLTKQTDPAALTTSVMRVLPKTTTT